MVIDSIAMLKLPKGKSEKNSWESPGILGLSGRSCQNMEDFIAGKIYRTTQQQMSQMSSGKNNFNDIQKGLEWLTSFIGS